MVKQIRSRKDVHNGPSSSSSRPRTIGIIVECGPDGADKKVTEYLAGRVVPGVQHSCITLDNKPQLIDRCGATAAELLAQGCVGVIIVWDLHPAWRIKREPPCRRTDRELITASLVAAGVPLARAHLVCVSEELEAWLLADGRAVSSVLSTAAHAVRIASESRPDRVRAPKTKLNRIFQQNMHTTYVDRYHAIKIVQALPDLNRIQRSESFRRFAERVQRIAS